MSWPGIGIPHHWQVNHSYEKRHADCLDLILVLSYKRKQKKQREKERIMKKNEKSLLDLQRRIEKMKSALAIKLQEFYHIDFSELEDREIHEGHGEPLTKEQLDAIYQHLEVLNGHAKDLEAEIDQFVDYVSQEGGVGRR